MIVRCEEMNISGSFYRNKCKAQVLDVRRGNLCVVHFSEVSEVPEVAMQRQPQTRALPLPCAESHLLPHGARHDPSQDQERHGGLEQTQGWVLPPPPPSNTWTHIPLLLCQVFEGIPPPYNKEKRMVVPAALRVLRLKPGRRVCCDIWCSSLP